MTRIKKGKIAKRKVFILVEGRTEQIYFDLLRQKLRLGNLKIKMLDNVGNNWIEKAKLVMKNDKNFKRDKYTDVYVCFDKDEFVINDLQKINKVAKIEKITIGFSNIMFEVWLLAHFETVSNGLLSKSALKAKLSRYLDQEYVKANSAQLEKIVELYSKAIDNSKSICEINYDKQCTTIGKMIEQIGS